MSESQCRADGCGVLIKPEFLMCNKHWKMVPIPLRNAIWRHFRIHGQPTREALRLIARAIQVVREKGT